MPCPLTDIKYTLRLQDAQNHRNEEKRKTMSGEIFNAAVLSFTLILVGLGLGFLLLKIQGGGEESL